MFDLDFGFNSLCQRFFAFRSNSQATNGDGWPSSDTAKNNCAQSHSSSTSSK
jgi:hypothetical protein